MNYEIVKYHPEFKRQVVELQRHLWGPDVALNAAYLEWKYERNPYLDGPHIYLALCGGLVVGMRGWFGCKWQIGYPSQTFPGLCGGDGLEAAHPLVVLLPHSPGALGRRRALSSGGRRRDWILPTGPAGADVDE